MPYPYHRFSSLRPAVALTAFGSALAACTVGPDYHAPDVAVPPHFSEAARPGASARDVDLERWWRSFDDPQLNDLVATALSEGLDMRMAASRIRRARYAAALARAQFLPQVNANAGATRMDFSKNAGFSSLAQLFGGEGGDGGGIALPGGGITTYSAGFDASWELDLFGGVKRSAEAARARLDAARWNSRDASVTLAAEVADSYLQLRTLQHREAILRDEAARQRRLSALQQHRAAVGLTPETDPIRQRAALSATEAAIEPVLVQERIQMHALALLLGKPPGALIDTLSAPNPTAATPPVVPPGLPSELLRRRPDVRAAERRLAAATADIGVAVADLYPKFSLTGAAQLISTSLSSLLESDSLQTRAAGQAVFPILDFGRGRGQVRLREEDREQAYIAYQQTVLTALKDVEDALARVAGEQRRRQRLTESLANAERAEHAAAARQRAGLADISAVLQAQASVLEQRNQLAQSDGALKQALASLYKALGGGWSEATLDRLDGMQRTPLDAPDQPS
ncbi:efflux transporter outer membrane subunit [Stakelama saccharophila]|uniref:Efflux transporter outer membrane subunit n=1 Tax=Stakelama saccharophila TaxID=3075605 RepID=A0ABZ0BCQ8_9SPHN|nr:efflux transporter outer membrane subunit [Stakelama sp. W311]WNO55069.1 efflux transporter outer membrane subunit [Stakelama sp. W311]